MKLTREIILVFVLFAAALLAGVGITTYRSACQSLQVAVSNQLEAAALARQGTMSDIMEMRVQKLEEFAATPEVRKEITEIEQRDTGVIPEAEVLLANGTLVDQLKKISAAPRTYQSIAIIDGKEGRIIASTTPGEVDKIEPKDPHVPSSITGAFMTDAVFSLTDNTATTTLAVPIFSEERQLLGIITAEMDVKRPAENALRRTGYYSTDDVFIIDKHGLAITTPRSGPIRVVPLKGSFVESCLQGGSGTMIANDETGIPSIIAYRWMPEWKMGVILKVNLNDALAPAYALGRTILWISMVALLIACALAIALGRNITRPLLRLKQGVRRFAEGEHLTRLPQDFKGEVGELAREFNRMAASIVEMEEDMLRNADQLEKRVADRTGQLASANFKLAEEFTERVRISEELRSANEWAEATNRSLSREVEIRGETEVRLRAAILAAEAANQAKSEFLANMSHEIRTPMNGILGMTELTLETTLTPDQRDYLTLVQKSGHNLLSIINDILDFAKIESGKLDLEFVEFDLREIVAEIVKPLGIRAGQKSVELISDISASVPDRLLGDAGHLRQVLTNLVGNAVKFTEKGEVALEIHSEPAEDGNVSLTFAISDTGIGIAPERQRDIFAAFVQADGSTTRRFGGTGLGLAISSALVEQMKGKMTLQSVVGQGSRFEFGIVFSLGENEGIVDPPVGLTRLAGMRILIVDDNDKNRVALRNMAEGWGMKPTDVSSGAVAIQELEHALEAGERYSLVLLDAKMPDMDGFTVAERIARQPQLAQTTLMMLAPGAQPSEAKRARELGISGIVTKPVVESDILSVLPGLAESTVRAVPNAVGLQKTARPLNVLVAEDNPVNQLVALSFLNHRGHKATIVDNGRKAVDAFTGNQDYDIILMDVQMPEMDGLEATARIRAFERHHGKHIPIVALTARAMKGDAERCLAAGMDCYLSKPFTRAEFLHAIEQAWNENLDLEAATP